MSCTLRYAPWFYMMGRWGFTYVSTNTHTPQECVVLCYSLTTGKEFSVPLKSYATIVLCWSIVDKVCVVPDYLRMQKGKQTFLPLEACTLQGHGE